MQLGRLLDTIRGLVSAAAQGGQRMKPKLWLLLALEGDVDPIRIQKTMFLFAMEAGAPASDRYRFEPYNWGPLSTQIYRDLEALSSAGLVEAVPVPGATYSRYRRTPKGTSIARVAALDADPHAVQFLSEHGSRLLRTDFDTMLREVYDKYPEYATKSLFRR
jgi:hypothetical protein